MSAIDIDLPAIDINQLQEEFMGLKAKTERATKIERELKERPPTKEEEAFLADMPNVYKRAVEVTRILRRTNTGPARVKTKTPRQSKKADAQAKIDKLLDL